MLAFSLTAAWVTFSIWVSDPWRHELEDAIGPVMAWVIPTFLGYIPGLVIGFMRFRPASTGPSTLHCRP